MDTLEDKDASMLGLRTSDYFFDLPEELIAQDPLEDRHQDFLYLIRIREKQFIEALGTF